MSFLSYISKPEYLFRPFQIARRIAFAARNDRSGFEEMMLPWGLPLRVRPSDAIGASVCALGIYDLSVTETIWRLLEPGGCALDVGANIGHMSSAMAARAGEGGVVHLFEPHPQIYQELEYNARLWADIPGVCRVSAHRIGLSDANGEGLIEMPETFDGNRGTAFVVADDADVPVYGTRNVIQLSRLDDFWSANGNGRRIDLMKVDVEGHELSVFKGAAELIRKGLIRDIVFEENRPYPTDVCDYLGANGYSVFLVEKGFWGPLVSVPMPGHTPRIPWEPPAYLATREPDRALDLLNRRGWRVLGCAH